MKISGGNKKSTPGFNGTKPIKRKPDDLSYLRKQGKKPGNGLDDYSLDLMKLS